MLHWKRSMGNPRSTQRSSAISRHAKTEAAAPLRDGLDPVCYYLSRVSEVAAVAEKEAIDLIVLFGSAARNRLGRESDVDVAVRFRHGRPGFEVEARVAAELDQALRPPRELDLVLLNQASPLLLALVAAEGVVLFEPSAEVWPLFRLYARKRFEDTEKYRRRHWQAFRERELK